MPHQQPYHILPALTGQGVNNFLLGTIPHFAFGERIEQMVAKDPTQTTLGRHYSSFLVSKAGNLRLERDFTGGHVVTEQGEMALR